MLHIRSAYLNICHQCVFKYLVQLKFTTYALTHVDHFVGHLSAKRKVATWFLIRAHAWVVGSVPGQGMYERQLIDVSLSHQSFSPSLSPSFSRSLKNK